jgi:hypothetical protein
MSMGNALPNSRRTLLVAALALAGVVAFYQFASFSSSARTPPVGDVPVVRAVATFYPHLILRGSPIMDKEPATVSVEIDDQGNVTSARAVGGQSFFTRPAVLAAKQWRFAPSENGEKIRTTKLIFMFRIMPPDTPPEDIITVFIPPNSVEIRTEYFKVPGRDD